MIKINLLNSVTERQGGAVVAVDRKVSSAASRIILMSVVVTVLLVAVCGWVWKVRGTASTLSTLPVRTASPEAGFETIL